MGLFVIATAVKQILVVLGQDLEQAHVATNLFRGSAIFEGDTISRLHPKLVLQDSADAQFQRWVTQGRSAEVLEALSKRSSHSAVEQVLLSSLNFFCQKLAAHSSAQHLHAALLDNSGKVTFKGLYEYCQGEPDTSREDLKEAAQAVLVE